MSDFYNVFILMVVVWTAGRLLRPLGIPLVFGELMGGILVGPALLNLIDPNSETIHVLSELGIFFLMVHAGLKTNHEELFAASKNAVIIGLGGMILPLLGGYFTARLFDQSVSTSLFVAITLSISAIPLTARLLKDCKLENTPLANTILGAAVIEDILALVLFSLFLNVHQAGSFSMVSFLFLLFKVITFFAVIIYGGLRVSPYLRKVLYRGNRGFTFFLIIALLLGLIAEWIGLHAIIGAFLAGLFIRKDAMDPEVFHKIEDRIYGFGYGFLGPLFFASLAFHLDWTAFYTAPLFLGAILLVAFSTKVIGCGWPALWLGMKPIESCIVGLAMNNRGAVELIIAAIGLEMGIIDQTVFSILVTMAFLMTLLSIVTTAHYARRLHASA